jgi:hypothetical protein
MSQHLRNCKERKAILARLATDETKQKTRLFHIQAEGRYAPQYWLHLEIPADATLEELDDFLRDIWFDYDEHLSGFRIDDTPYASEEIPDFPSFNLPGEHGENTSAEEEEDAEEEEEEEGEIVENFIDGEKLLEAISHLYDLNVLPPDVVTTLKQDWFLYDLLSFLKEKQKIVYHQMIKAFDDIKNEIDEARRLDTLDRAYKLMIALVEDRSTNVQLQYVLKVEKKFYYTYDYGDSTYVTLRVVSEREGIIGDEDDPVELLALNVAPVILCTVCGKPATQIAVGYHDLMEQPYCEKCVKKFHGEITNEDEDEEDEDSEERYYYEGFIDIVNSPRVGVVG